MNELDTLGEGRIVFDNRRLGDPDRRVLEQRLHDQREPQLRGPHQLVAVVEFSERRHADAVIGEDLLGQRFVAGDEQCGRRRSRVPIAVHVEQGGNRVLVARVLAKPLATVEHELGLEVGQLRQQWRDVVADADHEHLVPAGHERAGDVVLRLLGFFLDLALEGRILPLRVQ